MFARVGTEAPMSVVWLVDRTLVDQQMADDVDGILGADPADWAIHDGKRSDAQQAALFAQGRTAPGPIVTYAEPDRDPHVRGYAVDFHELIDGKANWSVGPNWRRVMLAVDAHPRLHGGWHFPHPDYDHIQSTAWYKVRGW